MLTLSHPLLGSLDLDDKVAYLTELVTMPMPAVRPVVDNRTDADGTFDRTAHVGARAVTASVVCFAAPGVAVEERVDALRRFLHPSVRATLTWVPVGESVPRQLTVRAQSHDLTLSDFRYARTAISWVAPAGVMESSQLHTQVISPAATGVELGRVYDLTFDRTYPASSGGTAETIVVNAGSAPARWRALLYGQASNPELTNVTLGATLEFNPLTVALGHYIDVDQANRHALLDSDADLSVYDKLTLASQWWPLVPGENRLTFTPTSFEVGSQAIIEWRDTWL